MMSRHKVEKERYVCRNCIKDAGLQEVVDKFAENEKCHYCLSPRSAILEYVTDRMKSAISTEYGALEDNLDAYGQIPDEHYDIDGVLDDLQFTVDKEELLDDIKSVFRDQFFCIDSEKSYLRRVRWKAWREFTNLVKHKKRYTFWNEGEPQGPELDELMWNTGNLLGNIAKAIDEFGLIMELPQGTPFWRVRLHNDGDAIDNPKGYATPPTEYAKQPNRMSPAGIPMFYGAEDFETAYLETTDAQAVAEQKVVSGIQFIAKRNLIILDLTNLPANNSFFNEWDFSKRNGAEFLSAFAREVSIPIVKDGREHIEYVPTQVFTEYVRYQLKVSPEDCADGIKYSSSKNQKGCYVLFVEHDQCLDGDNDQVLEGLPTTLQTRNCT